MSISRVPLRRTLVAALAAAALAAGCRTARTATAGEALPASSRAADSVALEEAMAEVVRVAPRSAMAWPGFTLQDQLIVIASPSAGLVIVHGDSASHPNCLRHPRFASLRYWRGNLPDSLPAKMFAADWNGTRGTATIFPVPPGAIRFAAAGAIHESFHTFQVGLEQRDSSRFPRVGEADFPVRSVDAVALLSLEATYLGRALTEPDPELAAEHARHALAVRHHRCSDSTARCTAERGIEHHEGAAVFATATLLGRVDGYGPAGAWQESIAGAISPVRERSRLPRWHFYDTGLIWYTLVRRFAGEMPHLTLERTPPDIVLARVLGYDPAADGTAQPKVLAGAAHDSAYAAARAAEWGLATRPGAEESIPIRVHFGKPTSFRTTTGVDPQRGLVTSIEFGSNRMEFIGESTSSCCPGARFLAPANGRVAIVDGVPYALDVPVTVSGALTIRTDEMTVTMPRAELRIMPDSVVITVLPGL